MTTKQPRKRTLDLDEDPLPVTPSSTPISTPSPGDDLDIASQDYQVWSPPSEFPPSHAESNPTTRRRRLSKSQSHRHRLAASSVASHPGFPSNSSTLGPLYGPPVSPRRSANVVFSPVLPPPESRYVEHLALSNPFDDNADDENRLVLGQRPIQRGAKVDGYIKFHNEKKKVASEAHVAIFQCKGSGQEYSPKSTLAIYLSPQYMGEMGLQDNDDRSLFAFYLKAWCPGRSVLDQTNCWFENIPRMASKDSCVRSAILALAGTYVLDYQPRERIRQVAQRHYKTAVILLNMALRDARKQLPTENEANCMVAAIALLNMIDVVSPEQRRPPNCVPRWLEGARLACRMLDATDPGHRYWNPVNIQPSEAQTGNMIIAGRAAILALPMTPLDLAATDNHQFAWLLQGSEHDVHRVHGGCGMSPTLLHRFSQITHLSAFLSAHPIDSEFLIKASVDELLGDLRNLRQWTESASSSAVSRPDKSRDISLPSDLLSSIKLGKHGLIVDRNSMTEVTAEAWRLAAIIYLRCRLERLPRSHPDVVSQISELAKCIRVMPTSGTFFTAQAPFFPVFLLGVLALHESHVQCALDWFHSVISTSCRSSVPPAFRSLERVRAWMDPNIHDMNPSELPRRIFERYPWWETLVAHIVSTEGTLCLI
ncbi:hypothetical protein CH63R_08035 [Colletotrichum higginsianum IMI 349063]|uniref:Uncharacterized protein n=3 Tax=Colletotrichum higginsianum TaxID=80884 RepID=A0A1B7YBQ9_COLHI|nr:hypothetical protein CH63R_08035 [Colletotrichum higginsianum IMI 349063]OBR09270.1 hypothetical protein CH63R_08035 [Colletotrichum higginsianum IMI 349063]TIC95230.1 hypothetical protein CH35J_008124 [Colletotrichum higginsianum]